MHRDRRQPAPARHRLRRPLPDPPLGLRARRSRRRMEALHDVVKAGKARYIGASSMWAWQFAKAQHVAERARLDAVRLDAEPLQPALPRGGARDAAAVRRPGRRRHPVEPARARPADPRRGTTATDRSETDEFGTTLYVRATPTAAIVERRRRGRRRRAACRGRRSRWPGCCEARPSPRRSSAPPSRTTSRTRSPSLDLELTADEIARARGAVHAAARAGFV